LLHCRLQSYRVTPSHSSLVLTLLLPMFRPRTHHHHHTICPTLPWRRSMTSRLSRRVCQSTVTSPTFHSSHPCRLMQSQAGMCSVVITLPVPVLQPVHCITISSSSECRRPGLVAARPAVGCGDVQQRE